MVLIVTWTLYCFASMVCGYHKINIMYVWDAVVDEILPCSSEDGNLHDPYVKVIKKGSVIEWMPTDDHSN